MHVEGNDGHVVGDGGEELKDDPRTREHGLGLQDDEHLRVFDVVEEKAQVRQVVFRSIRDDKLEGLARNDYRI